MAKNKKSFIFYCDWITIFEKLSDDEAGRLTKHLLRYVNDQNPESPDRITDIIFEPIKQQLKRDLRGWELSTEKRSNAGKKGMESRWGKQITNDNNVKKTITKITDTVTVNDNKIFKPESYLLNGCVEIWDDLNQSEKTEYKRLIWDEIINLEIWINDCCRMKKYNINEFKKQLQEFIKDQGLNDGINRGIKSLKEHFLNYYKKNFNIIKA